MKIDFVITGMDIGGAEMQAIDLLSELKRRGHVVRLISLTPPVSQTDRLLERKIPVISLEMKNKTYFINAAFKLRKIILNNKTDVVHGHMFHANILVRLVKLFTKSIPVICTAHSTYEGGKIRDYVYRLTNHFSELNTVVSEAAKYRYIKDNVFPAAKTKAVFNCINTNVFLNLKKPSDELFHWITVGRLVSLKNQISIIKAIRALPGSDLTIVGDGPERENLERYVNEHGLTQRVNFTGAQSDLNKYYNKSNAFVLASKYEGFALVVAEAMSCGLMVVATDCGGPADIIGKDDRVGKLVPPDDDEQLLLAMQKVVKVNEIERDRIGKMAREHITERFSLHKIVSEWESIYRTLI